MFDSLHAKLEAAFKKIRGRGVLSAKDIESTMKEVRMALLEADVNFKVAKEFCETLGQKAQGEQVLKSLTPDQQIIKLVHEQLIEVMGAESTELNLSVAPPAIIMLVGLQGSGKTTFSAKFAFWAKTKNGRQPLLVAADVYRPAAVDQLQVLGGQIGVTVYAEPGNTDAVAIARNALTYAKTNGYNVVIVDTAGRLAIDEAMMREIAAIKDAIRPQETLFVVDSMTGQDAVNTAKAFNDRLNFDGVVLTKLDGDTRGGAALSIRSVVDKPIKFVSQGEKTETLDVFHPDRMARRILGMGDIVSLVEKAQEQYDEVEAQKLQRKMRKNQFDFDDFLSQLGQIKKMGNVKDLLSMIPGVGKQLKDLDIDESHFKRIESMIQSMTPEERANPDVINSNRRQRIAKGSGHDIQAVNQFIKQFEDMRKMMKTMNKMSTAGRGMNALNAIKAKR